MDQRNGGQIFFYSWICLWFLLPRMSTNWFEKSQLDLEDSTFYVWKETQNHPVLSPTENKLPFPVISRDGQPLLIIAL